MFEGSVFMKSKRFISAVTSFVLTASCVALPGTGAAADDGDVSLMSYYTTNGASSDNGDGTYKNPVLYTDVADPDVICAPGPDGKEAYYMVSTAMSSSPGCPIMKSYDLVNWETVSYLYDSLDFNNDALALRNGKQAYGWGQWATSIKYDKVKEQFYILLFSYTTGTTQIYTTKDIENGPWKKSDLRCYHDSSIFIDDDGEVYVFYGQNEFYCMHLIEEDGYLREDPAYQNYTDGNDGVRIIEDSGDYYVPDFIDSQYAGVEKGTLAEQMDDFIIRGEGCHAYKVDGVYYLIFITWPGGDIWRRSEACFRSVPDENGEHHIYGPYEGMMVMSENVKYDGYTGGQGVAQGGITNAIGGDVRSSDGNWYGIIYQDRGAAGRCPMLVNVDWNKEGYEGWPMMSVAETGDIPDESGEASEIKSLVESDEFDNGTKRTTPQIITKPEAEVELQEAAEPVELAETENGPVTFNFILKNNYWQDVTAASESVQPNEWTQLTGEFTVPDDWTGGYIAVNTSDSTTDFYVDDCSVKDSSGTEILQTGDMEGVNPADNGVYYWGVNTDDNSTGTAAASDEAYSGAHSLFISGRSGAGVGAMQYVNLTPGETYIVSAWVKFKGDTVTEPDPVPENGYELSGSYISNGDMESVNEDGTPSYWGASGTAAVTSNDIEYAGGSRSMKVADRAAASDGAMQYTSADTKADKTYKVSMKIKSDQTDTFKFIFQNNFWQDMTVVSQEVNAGEWTEISGYFDTPDDFDGGSIRIVSENTNADFYVDDVTMQLATEVGVDIVTNGGFEDGLSPWTGRYGDVKVELSSDAHSGSNSAYVSNRTDTGQGAKLDIAEGLMETPREYTVSAWIKYDEGPDEKTFNLTVESDSATSPYTVLASGTVKKGEWCEITGTATLGSEIGTVKSIYIETPWSASPTADDLISYYVDDVSVIKQPEVEWETVQEGENDYNGSNLKLVWQWNHNPDNRYWSLTERPGYLRLGTAKVVENIQQAKNTLTQRTFGPVCSGWTKLDVSNMRNGDYAGLGALQEGYGLLAVKKYGGQKTIVIVEPESEPDEAALMMDVPTKETFIANLDQDEVYFKTEYEFHGEEYNDYVRFYYSLDGVNWTFAYEKNNLKYHLTHFAGYKFALFNYATNSLGGYVDFDYFRVDDKITGAGETENINVELGSPETVAGVPNKEYTVPVTMDSVPAGSEKIEAVFTIPENSELSTVMFGSGVSDKAKYEVKDGKVIITVEGDDELYTAGADRKFADLVFKTTDFIQENITLKFAPDYIRIYGESDGKEIDVSTQNATAEIVMNKPDYGTVIKHPGLGNPLITHKYGADPFALEYNGRLYLYLTGDNYYLDENGQITASPETGRVNNEYANAQSITVISTSDMVNWTDHGEIKAAGPDGAATFANYSWAPCIAVKEIDGKDKFFLYYTDNTAGIVVLEGDSPVGPFTSPLDKHLIGWEKDADGNYLIPGVEDCVWIFDPAVLVDDDGSAYLYFGGGSAGEGVPGMTPDYENPGSARVVKLGDDMVSLDGEMEKIDAPCILEDSGIHKYNGKYYYSYSTNWYCESLPTVSIAYLVSDSPMGPFEAPEGEDKAGIVLPAMGDYFDIYSNNHHSIFEFKDEWYIVYHCGLVDAGYHTTAGYLGYRSAQINKIMHNDNDTMDMTIPDRKGVEAVDTLDPYKRVEAETIAWHKEKVDGEYQTVNRAGSMDTIWIEDDSQKMKTAVCGEPGGEYDFNNLALTNIKNGDWSAVANADFGNGGKLSFAANVKGIGGGTIKVYLDSLNGECIAELNVPADSGYGLLNTDITADVSGVHNIFFAYEGGDGQLFDIDYWQFEDNTPRDWQLRAELENGAVKAEVTKLSGDVETAVVYAAAYASNGALISVSAQEVEPEAGGSVSVTLELDTEGASEIKAFLWTDGMVALDRAVKVK